MKKKQFIFNPDQAATQNNARAVTAVLKKKQKHDQKPRPGADPAPVPTKTDRQLQPVIIRRKSAEKRTKEKQLLITPDAYRKLRERAEKEDTTINNCISALTAGAILSGMQVKREKAGQAKTCRQIAVCTPSLLAEIETAAAAQGVSVNEFICFVLENSDKVSL